MRKLFGGSPNKKATVQESLALVQVPSDGTGTGLALMASPSGSPKAGQLQVAGPSQAAVQANAAMNNTTAKKTQAAKHRNVNVVEMLEFVKSLEVDPVKESEMLWIAEEAYQAQLPPGWEEHVDEHGRTYFHNMAEGESCWQHPMDSLFKQIIAYWRRVQITGGFWEIEDELKDIEEQIRVDLQYWMELFDEHGEKFYYNKRTEESRFDDPRNGVYHDLYARIRMVAKMKERLPLLARAPRPEDPNLIEIELQRKQQEQQEILMESIFKIQSAARVLLAKKKMRALRAKAVVGRGFQPLKGRVELRLTRGIGRKEVVLRTTEAHKQFQAAQKIQSVGRGKMTRDSLLPVIAHRAYLQRQGRIIKNHLAACAKVRREKKEAEARVENAASLIAASLQIVAARAYVQTLKIARIKFDRFVEAGINIQCWFRQILARRVVVEKRRLRRENAMTKIKSIFRVFRARCHLVKCQQEDEPFEMFMGFTQDERAARTLPYTFKFMMHPVDFRGRAIEQSSYCRSYRFKDQEKGWSCHQPTDLFSKVDPWSIVKRQCVVKMQCMARVFFSRSRVHTRRELIDELTERFNTDIFNLIDLRQKSATRIQARRRGIAVRKCNHLYHRRKQWEQKVVPQIEQTQAYLRRYLAQCWLTRFTAEGTKESATIIIQSHWRRFLAKRETEKMREIVLFPMRGWFEYTGTGADAVRVDVQFVPNDRFDEFQHFCAYGSYDDLNFRLEVMRREVEAAQAIADKRARKEARALKRAQDAKEKQEREEREAREKEEQERLEEEKRELEEAQQKAIEERRQKEKMKLDMKSASGSRMASAVGTARSQRSHKSGASGYADSNWSPRRGNLGPDADIPAREWEPKKRDPPKELPSSRTDPSSPLHTIVRNKIGVAGAQSSQPSIEPQVVSDTAEASAPTAEHVPEVVIEQVEKKESSEALSDEGSDEDGSRRGSKKSEKAEEQNEENEENAQDLEEEEPGDEPIVQEDQSALEVLQDAALEGGLSSSSRALQTAPRKHYAGKFANGQFVKTHAQKLEDLSEEEQAALMMDIQEERRRKVEELIRRQKKHAARRKKEQLREAEKLGQKTGGQFFEEEHRRRKVRELRKWLKKKEAEEQLKHNEPPINPMDKLLKSAALDPALEKIEQSRREERERRARIHDNRMRNIEMQSQMATAKPPGRVLHRHVHHHMHYHDGVSDAEMANPMQTMPPVPMMQSSSAIDLRRAAGNFDAASQSQTAAMPWRPLVHSASAGVVLTPGKRMSGSGHGSGRSGHADPYGLDRTVEAFRGPHPQAYPQGVVLTPGKRMSGSGHGSGRSGHADPYGVPMQVVPAVGGRLGV